LYGAAELAIAVQSVVNTPEIVYVALGVNPGVTGSVYVVPVEMYDLSETSW
jgi:hypothetical protein